MAQPVTLTAQNNEIFLFIDAHLTTSNDVVDLELIAAATVLTTPSVALENAPFELAVRRGIQA